ncbi:MAG: glycoside hydrolase family protein [Methanobrevibacter sp.]|nr:glycoside hydrolase family protein [Methanobrevibacter sp.]
MKTSNNGLNLIKRFEGCHLTAYKDPVGIPTIGYGHIKGVKMGMKITQAQADAYLKEDVVSAEKAVSKYSYPYTQDQFDALVSFTYNCGAGNLAKLTNNGTRTLAQISARIPAYNKAGGKELRGLVNRRAAEKALFDTYLTKAVKPKVEEEVYNMKEIKRGSKGKIVKVWQAVLGVEIDGSFGPDTEKKTKALQKKLGLTQTGVVDKATWKAGLESV